MTELFLIENKKSNNNIFSTSNEVFLHENIIEIIFKFKEKICTRFDDIRGTFLIDHFAINIIDPNNRLIIFSTTPSVEYNLISQDLWKYDRTYSIGYQSDNRFYSWEKAYEEKYFEKLRLIKQIKHGFSFGFNLSKKIESFQFIYSFATRNQKINFLEYYRGYINELFAIGDYGYKCICDLYEKPFGKIVTPLKINSVDKNIKTFSPFLKLINSKK